MAFMRRASAETMAIHESPRVMTLPLLVLAFGAVFAGWLGYELFVGIDMKQFWGINLYPANKYSNGKCASRAYLGKDFTRNASDGWVGFAVLFMAI